MANVDRPRGFYPIGTESGSPWQATVKLFYLDGTANTRAIAVGDLVYMAAGGYLNRVAAGDGVATIVGVVVGVPPADIGFSTTTGRFGDNFLSNTDPTLSGASTRSVAASTAGYVYVCTAPDVLMVGQEDGAVDPLTLADVGANVEIIGGGADATTGNSTAEIDSSSHATTATLPLQLVGLYQSIGNELGDVDTTKPWADWVVRFANHITRGGVAGI